MRKKFAFTAAAVFSVMASWAQQNMEGATRAAFQDKNGVIRWGDDKKEVSLFGANYCLASACDYRAAGYLTTDRKKVVDQDMAHFARMGFNALRLSFWGDYENTDKDGNLIQNDHLNMLDYVVAKAKERGIYMLLSPIVTYSSTWPDVSEDTISIKGSLAQTFKKAELGTNLKAIAAQCNYLKQLLNHVNPYTGIALKADPAIIFIEMINEPAHHSKDVQGSIRYINALVDAVRSTGCKKILFHNLSQDFNMAVPLQRSKIQGATFAWYPSGLNSGHMLKGNYLPVVDEYSADMLKPELNKLARIVYEFDSPDLLTGYMYPAMARSFRRMGAQWASIFSYDMLTTAPYNLGWQTHYINMVYTPQKAISAIIAGEVMRDIPMYKDYGKYPANTNFGPFKVDYEHNLGELNTAEKFMYTSPTEDKPREQTKLQKVVGYGSSPVVKYEGKGIYFLDKIKKDAWRLEVYPDAVLIDDPFKMPSPDRIVTRSIHRTWPMQVSLPGLGSSFAVSALDDNNTYATKATESKFDIRPGVYLLTGNSGFHKSSLPNHLGYVKMNEFVCLDDQQLPTQVVNNSPTIFVAGKDLAFSADVFSLKEPLSVILFVKAKTGGGFNAYTMKRDHGYTYNTAIPWQQSGMEEGTMKYCIVVTDQQNKVNYPSMSHISPRDWNYSGSAMWKSTVIPSAGPVVLMDPSQDADQFMFTRLGDGIRYGIFKTIISPENGQEAIQLQLPLNYDRTLDDYTVSLSVKDKLTGIKAQLGALNTLMLVVKGRNEKQTAHITLVENDGTSWSNIIPLDGSWQHLKIPIEKLTVGKGAMLPLGYPGSWKYWFIPADNRGDPGDHIKLENVEWVQISIRQSPEKTAASASDSSIAISNIMLGAGNN